MEQKKQKLFVHVFANIVICLVLVVSAVVSFGLSNKSSVIATKNSEYNGTIYAGDRSSKKISLMINVYWGTEYVEKMLDVLAKNNSKTTFFVGGLWAKDNKKLLERIKNEGHEIANHGDLHKEHGKISYDQNLAEIQKCHETIKELVGVEMELFAPPGGSYSKNTTKAAEFLGYKTIMWTRDTIDWRDKNASLIFNRATTGLGGGDLILMHPTEATLEAFPNIIAYAKKQGLEVCTVSETLGL